MFPVGAGPDRGRACVPAPPLNTAAGSAKATTCTLTSVTVSPALVSPSAPEVGNTLQSASTVTALESIFQVSALYLSISTFQVCQRFTFTPYTCEQLPCLLFSLFYLLSSS